MLSRLFRAEGRLSASGATIGPAPFQSGEPALSPSTERWSEADGPRRVDSSAFESLRKRAPGHWKDRGVGTDAAGFGAGPDLAGPDPSERPGVESEALYTTLVAGLAYSLIPTTIMGLTLLAIGVYAYWVLGADTVLAATCLGGLASLAKIGLLVWQRRRLRRAFGARSEAEAWEMAHVVTTCAVASSVGALSGGLFARADASFHMLATGLVFGYCSGVAARLFIRPKLAMVALVTAALPAAVSALTFGGVPERILAVIFLVFLGGSLESVRHLYNVSAREIETRLRLGRVARTDALTGLANRFLLQEAAPAFEGRQAGFAAVHCFDLDGFKAVNDRLGHGAGDDLLRQIAARLRAFLDEGDLGIRVGGDEFIVLQMKLEGPQGAERFAGQVHQALTKPYSLAGHRLEIGISYGYAVARPGAADLDRMMRAADAASYRAKRRGGGLERAV